MDRRGDATGQIHLRKADGSTGGIRKAYDGAIGRIVWKPDGKQITACGADGKVKSYAVPFAAATDPLKIIEADTVRIYDLAQSKDGTQLFTAAKTNSSNSVGGGADDPQFRPVSVPCGDWC